METITIINKSGKIVNNGKHFVNIFKDAKDAYTEKKAALRAEHKQKLEFKQAQKLLEARNKSAAQDTQSVASSRRSHKHRDRDGVSRPPLTAHALSRVDEASVASSRRPGSRSGGSRRGSISGGYRRPYVEEAGQSQPYLARRHTDFPPHLDTQVSLRPPVPPPYNYQDQNIHRSRSHPDLRSSSSQGGNEYIDMNLAYGDFSPDSPTNMDEAEKQIELKATMTKLDTILMEAHCVQHSATAIIKNLQDNPEAMAAVALTLAELSNILKTMSPAILTALKSSSPAVFALLASPQFLIAGGVALGVTVVMFGGYKIVKKLQDSSAARKEANRMEEALVWEPSSEMGSIETWRRGITAGPGFDADDNTSVDGEFITPEAARQRKERVKERRREEALRLSTSRANSSFQVPRRPSAPSSVASERTIRRIGSESTIRRKPLPVRSKTEITPKDSISQVGGDRERDRDREHYGHYHSHGHGSHSRESRRGSGSVKGGGVSGSVIEIKEKKEKKSSGLSSIFSSSKRGGGEKESKRESRKDRKSRVSEI